jgi:hypothetical protein
MRLVEIITESVSGILKSSEFLFHCVRNDEDILSIFADGLRRGTNVSFDTKGQAFEDEGGTILVFKKADYTLKEKDYQSDGVVLSGHGKPVAIIKDTSVHEKKGFNLDELTTEYENISKEFEKLGKAVDKTEDELKSYSYTMKRSVVPDWLTATQHQKVLTLRKQEDEVFAKMDLIGEADEIPSVTKNDVLKRYHIHKVPVYALPSRFRVDEQFNWAVGINKKHAENPGRQKGNEIVWLNAEEVIPLTDPGFRVTPDDKKNHIGNRMNKAEDHFKSGGWMDPPDVSFNKYDPKFPISFGNGRHRVAASLKAGEKWFPASMTKDSIKNLSKIINVKNNRP